MKQQSSYIFLIVFLCLSACSGGKTESSSNSGLTTVPPQKLTTLGVPLSAHAILSNKPDHKYDLSLDLSTNSFKGDIKVKKGTEFDLTVIYEADDPTTNQRLPIAHYIRKGLTARGDVTEVAYQGDEGNWEALFNLNAGQINDLDRDGDGYNNFVEIGYRSNALSVESIPLGPEAKATRLDPLFGNTSVSLPAPGSSATNALQGNAEITINAETPFDVVSIELMSPSYGTANQTLRLDEKKYSFNLQTEHFVVGPNVDTMDLQVRVTDEFGLSRVTIIPFAVINVSDRTAPHSRITGLSDGDTLQNSLTLTWELLDPSGINNSSVIIKVKNVDSGQIYTLFPQDSDSNSKRWFAEVTFDISAYPNGSYEFQFLANDNSSNTNPSANTISATVVNATPAQALGANARVLVNGAVLNDLTVPILETETDVVLDSSLSNTFSGIVVNEYWDCATTSGSIWVIQSYGMTKTVTLPNVLRTDNPRQIDCTLTIRDGYNNGSSSYSTNFTFFVGFVNQFPNPPTVSMDSYNGTIAGPNNFKIDYQAIDPDGDALTYDVTIKRQNSDGSCATTALFSCNNLQPEQLSRYVDPDMSDGDTSISFDRSDCAPALTLGSGELANPFLLNARTSYCIDITAKDPSGAIATAPTAIVTMRDDDLLGWWRFEEASGNQVADSSGNGYDATAIDGNIGNSDGDTPAAIVSGILSGTKARQCDANDDYIEGTNFPVGSLDSFTIEGWVYRTVPLSSGGIWEGYQGNTIQLLARTNGTSNRPSLWTPQHSIMDLIAPEILPLNQWQHVAFVSDGKYQKAYIDGELVTLEEIAEGALTLDNFEICRNQKNNAQLFGGRVDEIAFYSRALSVDEIRRNCRQNDPGAVCPDPKTPIIVSPAPQSTLPATRVYLAWRSEKDAVGDLLYDNSDQDTNNDLNYTVLLDRDSNQDGNYNNSPNDQEDITPTNLSTQSLGSYWQVVEENSIDSTSDFRLKIRGDNNASYQSSRFFSTDNSLVSWWKFDHGAGSTIAFDETVNNLDGTLINFIGNTPWLTGILGNGLFFDGADDVVSVADHAVLDFESNDFTVSLWFKPDALGTNRFLIDKKYDYSATNQNGYQISLLADGRVQLFAAHGSQVGQTHDTCSVRSGQAVTIGQWHHLTASRINGVFYLYLDGQLVGTEVCTSNLWLATDYGLGIGRQGSSGGTTGPFSGLLDDLFIQAGKGSGEIAACHTYLQGCVLSGTVNCDLSCLTD